MGAQGRKEGVKYGGQKMGQLLPLMRGEWEEKGVLLPRIGEGGAWGGVGEKNGGDLGAKIYFM